MTPLTNPAFIGRMKELDVKFTSMKSEMFGVAKTVDTIDWAAYGQSQADARARTQTRTTPSGSWRCSRCSEQEEGAYSCRIVVAVVRERL